MILPSSSRIGETVSETGMILPSLRCRSRKPGQDALPDAGGCSNAGPTARASPMPFSGEGAANPGVALGASAGLPAPLSVWPRWRDRSMLFETELGECLGNKTFLISLAAHGQVEDHRCDTLPDRLRGRGDEAGRKRHQKPQAYLEGDEAGRHGSVGALDASMCPRLYRR
jgi:hypothetical protein